MSEEYSLNIVLIEPEIPQNTGNIARTCAATGARLHLVKPMGFKIDDKKLKRAGLDVNYENNCFLVFGKETKGLPEELLKENHDNCVRLPMRGIIRSLNLSNAVAVGTYEVLRQWNYPKLSQKGKLTKYEW